MSAIEKVEARVTEKTSLAYSLTADFLAVFFVLTGLLKLLPLLKTTAAAGLTDSSLYLFGGIVEVFIGIWWAFEIFRHARYWVTLAILTVFVGLGFYFISSGTTSCGCFGVIQTPPAVSLTISSAILIWLFTLINKRNEYRKPWQERMTLGAIAGILIGVAVFGMIDRDGVIDAWANHGVSPVQTEFNFAFRPLENNDFSRTITVRNFNPRPVSVIGYSKLKGCINFEFRGLPLHIPAGESSTFSIHFANEITEAQIEGLVSKFKQAVEAGEKIPQRIENELLFTTNVGDDFRIKIMQVVDFEELFRRIEEKVF